MQLMSYSFYYFFQGKIVLQEAIVLAAGIQGIANRTNDGNVLHYFITKISLEFNHHVIEILKAVYLADCLKEDLDQHGLFAEAIVEYQPKSGFLESSELNELCLTVYVVSEKIKTKCYQLMSLICSDNPTVTIGYIDLGYTIDSLSLEAVHQLLERSKVIEIKNPSIEQLFLVCKRSLCEKITVSCGSGYQLNHILTNLTPTSKLKKVTFSFVKSHCDEQLEK